MITKPIRLVGLAVFMILKSLSEFLITHTTRDGKRVFFDAKTLEWTGQLDHRWREIRIELESILEMRDSVPNIQDISREQEVLSTDEKWKTFFFYGCQTPITKNCNRCPITAELLADIPDIHTAMFSILAPGKHIPEHRGIYKVYIRYHLALIVPKARENCLITVNHQPRMWTEGESFIFDDTYVHEVRNDTEEERVVLIIDIERPSTGALKLLNKTVLALLKRSSFVRRPLDILNAET